jgi:glycosyltransferase involved in cell wall biosynthesis
MGCKVLCHLRGGWFRTWYENAQPLTRLMVRRTHAMVDGQIVLGENLRSLFHGLIPDDRVYVVPNGSDYPVPPATRPASQPVRVLFLSNFQGAKGMLHVAHAAEHVVKGPRAVEFIFAGAWRDRATRAAFEHFASLHPDLPLRVTGEVRGQKKFDLLASSDIFVLPTDYRYEGHPWAIVEAMSYGLPIISTNHAAIPQSVLDGVNGFLVPKHDPSAVADRLVRLIDDAELRRRMGEASRQLYERHFTEAAMVDRLGAAFHEVLSRPQRRHDPATATVPVSVP